MKPDSAVKTAARVATQASHFLNRTGSFINSAWGQKRLRLWQSMAKHGRMYNGSLTMFHHRASPLPRIIQEEYIDEETENLSKKG